MVQGDDGDRVFFFENGDPVHAAGVGFPDAYLGQMLVELELAPAPSVMEALQHQQGIQPDDRPLFGEVVEAKLMLERSAVERAVEAQTRRRFAQAFGLSRGTVKAVPGENESIARVARKVDGWPILLTGLAEHGADGELREVSDSLLGHSVKMKGSLRQLEALMDVPPELAKALEILSKPRRPDQLERLLKRRRARGLIRLLQLLDLLDLQPAAKAIPIPKATRTPTSQPDTPPPRRSSSSARPSRPPRTETSPPPNSGRPTPPPNSGRPTSPPSSADRTRTSAGALQEVTETFRRLKTMDHYEVLGVDRDDPPTVLRRKYHERLKRYHPDTLAGRGASPEIMEQVRTITARLNEAYQALENPEARAEYEELLSDERLQGDASRKDILREAELRAKMGRVHLNQRQYADARAKLRYAVDNDPHSPRFAVYLAWAMLADPTYDRKDALREGVKLLEDAIKRGNQLGPSAPQRTDAQKAELALWLSDAHYYLGRAFKEKEELRPALEALSKSYRLNPKKTEIEREIRLLKKRLGEGGGPEGGGALSKLFRRKGRS